MVILGKVRVRVRIRKVVVMVRVKVSLKKKSIFFKKEECTVLKTIKVNI